MGLKKIGAACLLLLILSIGVFMQIQAPAKETGQQAVHFKIGDEMTDSTGSYKYTVNEDGTAQILGHLKTGQEKVMIPSVLDGYTVTSIGKKAFYGERVLTDIEIPETVTNIGEQAFAGTGITGIRIPESVVSIERSAFADCDSPSFTELVIPDSVMDLGSGAFAHCRGLEKVVIGRNVTVIDDAAFMGCGKLSEVVVNGKLKKIGEEAFYDTSLSKINIPDSVIEIGDLAFYNSGLLEIMLPKSVTEIGNKAIGFCEDYGEKVPDVFITGYMGTAAYYYAKDHYVAYRDAETGEIIRYDFIFVPGEKIKKLIAGEKQIKLFYKEVEEATYRVDVKKVGAPLWKTYIVSEPSVVIRGLKSGKTYKVRVCALREVDGVQYCGHWSREEKVKVW